MASCAGGSEHTVCLISSCFLLSAIFSHRVLWAITLCSVRRSLSNSTPDGFAMEAVVLMLSFILIVQILFQSACSLSSP